VLAVSSQSCNVEMSLLKVAPFYLQQADSVIIKVACRNLVGWSPYSDANIEADGIALLEDIPHKALASPSRDDVLTSDELL
jgi:hypothetical protein